MLIAHTKKYDQKKRIPVESKPLMTYTAEERMFVRLSTINLDGNFHGRYVNNDN